MHSVKQLVISDICLYLIKVKARHGLNRGSAAESAELRNGKCEQL